MLRIAMVSFSAITFAGFATGSASANQAVVSQKFMQLAQTTCVFQGRTYSPGAVCTAS